MTQVLPDFRLSQPATIAEALTELAWPGAQIIAGGTDKVVQLRRGLAAPAVLVDITGIADLTAIEATSAGLTIGAGVTLARLGSDPALSAHDAITQAAASVAAPAHRSVATLGGNLCLDTRCLYYNQSHWWRQANDFCLKYQGDTCHVAPKGNRCRAVFAGDLAPALMVSGAQVEIAGPEGRRRIPLREFYVEDGAAPLRLAPRELLVAVHLPSAPRASAYGKIRQRGAIDFPLAGVAVAFDGAQVTVAVTGTNSCPVTIAPPAPFTGDDDWFDALEKTVQKAVSPQRTSTTQPHYRRLSVAALAARLARQVACP